MHSVLSRHESFFVVYDVLTGKVHSALVGHESLFLSIYDVLTGKMHSMLSGCESFFLSVYDVLTGKVHSVLSGHRACVRDVSWHPHRQELISTSVSFLVICM